MEAIESNYIWKFSNPNPLLVKRYKDAGISDTMSRVLINRDISIEEFDTIEQNFNDLLIEYSNKIVNLKEAAKFVLDHLDKKNLEIHIFSDYDTDGITSAAIAEDFFRVIFREAGIDPNNIFITVPERKDGYGMNIDWCHYVARRKKEDNTILVITFDNGITKVLETDVLLKANCSVLITDHHEPEENLPNCLIVDPKKDKDRFGEELCGAELAFMLCYMMSKIALEKEYIRVSDNADIAFKYSLDRCLQLAAVGTIADMMPMTLFNITLTKYGIEMINENEDPHASLVALKDCFGLNEITSKDIGFNIAAAVNACGQMNSANLGYELLSIYDHEESEIREKAEEIYKIYSKNKDITKKMKIVIQKEIDSGRFDNSKICICPIKNVPYGIAGKLATYLASSTRKPSVVLIDEDQEELRGSARVADSEMDLLGILKPFVGKGKIKFANGHKAACGVVFYQEGLETIQDEISEYISSLEEEGKIMPPKKKILLIDKKIKITDICKKTYEDIISIPYSMNFNSPNLLVEGELLKVARSKSNPNNVCYTLCDPETNKSVSIWAWNLYPKWYDENIHTKIRIVGNLNRNFMNPNTFTLDVIDFKLS